MTDRELLELAAKAAGIAGVVTNGRMVINEAGICRACGGSKTKPLPEKS